MAVGQVVAVFCVLVTTEVQSVTERLECAPIVKWVPMELAVTCVRTMSKDQSVSGVNLATGGSQRTAVKVLSRAILNFIPGRWGWDGSSSCSLITEM